MQKISTYVSSSGKRLRFLDSLKLFSKNIIEEKSYCIKSPHTFSNNWAFESPKHRNNYYIHVWIADRSKKETTTIVDYDTRSYNHRRWAFIIGHCSITSVCYLQIKLRSMNNETTLECIKTINFKYNLFYTRTGKFLIYSRNV